IVGPPSTARARKPDCPSHHSSRPGTASRLTMNPSTSSGRPFDKLRVSRVVRNPLMVSLSNHHAEPVEVERETTRHQPARPWGVTMTASSRRQFLHYAI